MRVQLEMWSTMGIDNVFAALSFQYSNIDFGTQRIQWELPISYNLKHLNSLIDQTSSDESVFWL